MAPSINTTKDAKALKRKAAEAQVDAGVAAFKAAKKSKKADKPAEKAVKKSDATEATPKKVKATTEAPTSPAAPSKEMTADEYRAKHDITVKGVPSPEVYQNFSDAPFPTALKNALLAAGFTSPSPIQVRC